VSICPAQTRERTAIPSTTTNQHEYPKEIRGYKLERVNIEVKPLKKKEGSNAAPANESTEPVITFGDAHVASVSPWE